MRYINRKFSGYKNFLLLIVFSVGCGQTGEFLCHIAVWVDSVCISMQYQFLFLPFS